MQYFLRSGAAEQDLGPLGLFNDVSCVLRARGSPHVGITNFRQQFQLPSAASQGFLGDDSFYADAGAARGGWRGDRTVIISAHQNVRLSSSQMS